MIMTTRPDQGEGRDALRKQLADFIEVLNMVLAEDDLEEITMDGDVISSIDWLGEDRHGYILKDTAGEELVREGELVYEQASISTREQFMNLCAAILKRKVGEATMFSQYSSYMMELERYIQDFAKKLKEEWGCFRDVSLFSLPIRITPCDTLTENGDYAFDIGGTANSQLISVFGVYPENRDRDLRHCRHETIHFMLFKALLDGADDSFIFWFFADLYDAHPYKEMNEPNKVFYEVWKKGYQEGKKDEIEELLQLMKDKEIHTLEKIPEIPNKTILQ